MSEETGSLPGADAVRRTSDGLRPSIFFFTVLMVFVADQMTKSWVVKMMTPGMSRNVFGAAFRLTLTSNTGGAWGLLPQGNNVFTVFAALAIVALMLAYTRVGRMDVRVGSAFALAMGGALGNLVDRIRLGYVVDFFDARIIHWPVFNLADSAITISILLLMWHFIKSPRTEPAPVPANDSAPVSADTNTL